MTKIYISVSSLQLERHYFKEHTAENRMQKFQVVPEIKQFEFEQFWLSFQTVFKQLMNINEAFMTS